MRESFCWWGICEGVYVPAFLLRYRGIGPAAKLCFARLVKHCGENQTCWPSQETLAEELGVTVRSIGNYLAELEADGFIEIIQRGLRQSNEYRPLRHPLISTVFCGTTSGQDRKELSDQDRKDLSGPSIELKEDNRRNTEHKEPLTGTSSYPEEKTETRNPTLNADYFLRESDCLPGKKYSGRDKKRIREFWNPDWSALSFAEVVVLVDRELGKQPRMSKQERVRRPDAWISNYQANGDNLRREPEPVAISLAWQSDAKYGTYLFELARTGKRVAAAAAAEAYRTWERLTDAQKDACIEDIKYLVQQASEFKYVPGPVSHLGGEPWNALRMPAAAPSIPYEKLSKHQQALYLARQQGLMK